MAGDPKPQHISTWFVEHQNRAVRVDIRRFTGLTNALSKKLENHIHAIDLHCGLYNFCRIHKTLRVTPTMAADVTGTLHDVD